jgi:FixJ family two-component response regulator
MKQRDTKGWRIPRTWTKSWEIYVRLVKGLSTKQIAGELEMKYNTVAVLAWKIRNPDDANAAETRRLRHEKASQNYCGA